jgi:hypothetical protein
MAAKRQILFLYKILLQETYWRNRIAEEISLERKSYEDNGIKDEYSVQMNIFSLCESIARKRWEG